MLRIATYVVERPVILLCLFLSVVGLYGWAAGVTSAFGFALLFVFLTLATCLLYVAYDFGHAVFWGGIAYVLSPVIMNALSAALAEQGHASASFAFEYRFHVLLAIPFCILGLAVVNFWLSEAWDRMSWRWTSWRRRSSR